MKMLVTGGAGFIGSNFIDYILHKYPVYRITCLDLLTYAGNIKNLSGALKNKHFTFVQGDITNRDFVLYLFKSNRFDTVVNFAAESHVDRSIQQPSVFLSTNILGPQILMDASRASGVQRFHQISTDEVYGDLPLDRPDLAFTEETALKPSSPYSASKASADLLVLSYIKTFGLKATLSRCSNNYGPQQFPEKLIPLAIKKAVADEAIPLYGTGENIRDWIHVTDHCMAIDKIMHDGNDGEVYNIGGGNERSNLHVVKTVLAELGRPDSLIQYVQDRPGHDRRYAIEQSKIKKLGWEPKIPFQEGIRNTVAWYLEHPDWWRT